MESLIVLHEDNHLLVALKPHGISVVSNKGERDLNTQVQEHLSCGKTTAGKSFCVPLYSVDKPAGGVVVFCKSAKALNRLNEQINVADENFELAYYCVTVGVPKQNSGRRTNYLKPAHDGKRLELVPQYTTGALTAEIDYSVVGRMDGLALLKLKSNAAAPGHERCQLAASGTPVYADAIYGKPVAGSRLAMWLTDVKLVHPTTERIMTFRAFPDTAEEPWNKFNMAMVLKII
ncbi:MAG: pseudouridine synthase [Firmicutes bacterium]|nr:pseudouridine synthase [Bacillota bacterium]